MIKAVIFDCFGVLVEDSLSPFYRKYLKEDDQKIELAHQKMAASNRGEITYDQFVEFLADLAGVTYQVAFLALDENPCNEQLIQFIRNDLKQHYKIGLLSNASTDWLDELFLPEDLELFDAKVLSYELGYAKPEAMAYKITAEKLNVRLDECIFIDDRSNYIEGAKHVGMKTILFTGTEQFKQDFARIINNS